MTSDVALQAKMAELFRRRRDLGKDDEARAFADEHIAGNARVSPVEQLEIYREQFWLRHTGSLVEDFPGVGGVLGQNDWERLVEEYLLAHPPSTFSREAVGVWTESKAIEPTTNSDISRNPCDHTEEASRQQRIFNRTVRQGNGIIDVSGARATTSGAQSCLKAV